MFKVQWSKFGGRRCSPLNAALYPKDISMAVEEVKVATNNLSTFIPVFSTIIGAGIAFAATYINAKHTKDRESTLALEQRERERVEKIYRLLVTLNNDISSQMSECINHIHSQQSFNDKPVPELPPLLELEMLINLYIPTLSDSFKVLLGSVHEFGSKKMEFRFQYYASLSKDKRQKDSATILVLQSKVDKHIKAMQLQLKGLVKV